MLKKYVGTGKSPVQLFKKDMDCCEGGIPCKYTLSTTGALKSFTYVDASGSDVTVSISASGLTDVTEIKAALLAAFNDLGYQELIHKSQGTAYKESVTVTKSGSTYTYTIYAELPLKSIVAGSSTVTFTKECDNSKVCCATFEIAYSEDPGRIAYDGSSGTAVGTTPWFAAGDADAVVSAVKAALTTETIKYYDVKATDNGSEYIVTIYVFGECSLLTLDGVKGLTCGTFIDFA